jgi:gluconolactonase
MIGGRAALAQNAPAAPPTTITTPPRDFGPNGAPTTYFFDPDVIAVDPSFEDLAQPNTAIKRLYTGLLWAEGPAWSAQGRYLMWSDIPNNRQMRWTEDDGRVSVFRTPSNNSNGNSFDFQGRQLSCEHLTSLVSARQARRRGFQEYGYIAVLRAKSWRAGTFGIRLACCNSWASSLQWNRLE